MDAASKLIRSSSFGRARSRNKELWSGLLEDVPDGSCANPEPRETSGGTLGNMEAASKLIRSSSFGRARSRNKELRSGLLVNVPDGSCANPELQETSGGTLGKMVRSASFGRRQRQNKIGTLHEPVDDSEMIVHQQRALSQAVEAALMYDEYPDALPPQSAPPVAVLAVDSDSTTRTSKIRSRMRSASFGRRTRSSKCRAQPTTSACDAYEHQPEVQTEAHIFPIDPAVLREQRQRALLEEATYAMMEAPSEAPAPDIPVGDEFDQLAWLRCEMQHIDHEQALDQFEDQMQHTQHMVAQLVLERRLTAMKTSLPDGLPPTYDERPTHTMATWEDSATAGPTAPDSYMQAFQAADWDDETEAIM